MKIGEFFLFRCQNYIANDCRANKIDKQKDKSAHFFCSEERGDPYDCDHKADEYPKNWQLNGFFVNLRDVIKID